MSELNSSAIGKKESNGSEKEGEMLTSDGQNRTATTTLHAFTTIFTQKKKRKENNLKAESETKSEIWAHHEKEKPHSVKVKWNQIYVKVLVFEVVVVVVGVVGIVKDRKVVQCTEQRRTSGGGSDWRC